MSDNIIIRITQMLFFALMLELVSFMITSDGKAVVDRAVLKPVMLVTAILFVSFFLGYLIKQRLKR